jgi:hypothetical protein
VTIVASVFCPLAVRRHLHKLGIELAENRHQVMLGGQLITPQGKWSLGKVLPLRFLGVGQT